MRIAGIDYGSKLAGTTVLSTSYLDNEVNFFHCPLNTDADVFIKEILINMGIEKAFLDAPLSLTGVYSNPLAYNNYFYREAYVQTRATSPMFIGGLSDSAIKLSHELAEKKVKRYEV